jgi:hypothetical protein
MTTTGGGEAVYPVANVVSLLRSMRDSTDFAEDACDGGVAGSKAVPMFFELISLRETGS